MTFSLAVSPVWQLRENLVQARMAGSPAVRTLEARTLTRAAGRMIEPVVLRLKEQAPAAGLGREARANVAPPQRVFEARSYTKAVPAEGSRLVGLAAWAHTLMSEQRFQVLVYADIGWAYRYLWEECTLHEEQVTVRSWQGNLDSLPRV